MSVERVGIVVEVTGGQEALSLMRNLESAIKRLNGTKLKFDFGGKEVQRLVTATQKAQELGNKMTETSVKSQSLGKIMGTTFNSVSSRMQHLGQSVTALGKGLQQLSSPMRALFRSTVLAAGFKALNMATEGLSGSFERYDTMQNYAKSMKALGLQADQTFKVFSGQKEAMTAIDNLNESVLGLPTGLDEIVAMQKVYAGATGEMVKSTKTAIAANNTFLASGMGSREQRFMQKYLVALASGAELTTTQWQSMARIAPLAMRAVSEEMKYSDYSKFTKDLQSGTIAGEEFLQSFIKVGTEGRVQEAANVMKTTFEGLSANVQNAFRRMGEGLLKALDDVFIGMNGRNLIQNLLGVDAKGRKVGKSIKDVIDGFSASLQNWVRANPDFFIDFLNTLKAFDWGGFVRGMGDGLLQVANALKSFLGFFSGEDVGFLGNAIRSVFGFFGLKEAEDFGRFMAKTPMFSKGLILLGNLLKGFKFPVAGIAALLKGLVALRGGGEKGGLFGVLGKAFGKKKDIETATETAKSIPTFAQSFQKMISSWTGALSVAGVVGITAGTGVGIVKAAKTIMSDISDIVDMMNNVNMGDVKKVAGNITLFTVVGSAILGFAGKFAGLEALKGAAIVGGITGVLSAFAAFDTWMLEMAFKNITDITGHLKEAKTNLQSIEGIKLNTGAIQTTIDSLGEVYDLLRPKYQGQGIGNAGVLTTASIKKTVSDIVDVVKSLGDFQKISKEISEQGEISQATTDRLTTTFERIGSIHKSIIKSFGRDITAGGTKNVKDIMKNTKDTFDLMIGEGGIISQFANLNAQLPSIVGGNDKRGADAVDSVRQRLGNLFSSLGEMYKSIAKDFGWVITASSTETFNEILGNTQDTFSKLIGEDGMITQIAKLSESLPNIAGASGQQRGQDPISNVKGRLINIFEQIGELYKQIAEDYGWMITGDSTANVDAIVENIMATFNKFVGEGGLITQISQLAEQLPTIVGGSETAGRGKTPMDTVKDYLTNLFTGMEEIVNAFNATTMNDDGGAGIETFAATAENFRLGIEKIKEAVGVISGLSASFGAEGMEMGEDGTFAIVEKIKSMVSQLSSAFNSETVLALSTQVTLFVSTVQNLLNQIQAIQGLSAGNPLDIQITLTHTISGKDEIVQAIKDANTAISDAVGNVKTSYFVPITVTLAPRVNRLPMPNTSIYPHTGGYVGNNKLQYRAKGGQLFKRKGTDTVPAMLTPGEYVQNKHAVDFWGIDFMRKVNRMDMRGVLNDVMARASHMASVGRQTIVNNTYNNQQVTINNGKAGAGFTFKSASRFAGAF